MKLHWKILIWLVLGVIVGAAIQARTEAPSWIGIAATDAAGGGAAVRSASGPAKARGIQPGDVVDRHFTGQPPDQREVPIQSAADLEEVVRQAGTGTILWLGIQGRQGKVAVQVETAPGSERKRWIAPFAFVADIFMALLKMLIVPLILTSIITGVTGIGSGGDLRRLGTRTFAYYILTSLLAIIVGLIVMNAARPGVGAALGLPPTDQFQDVQKESFIDVLRRMVPENPFSAFSDNSQMLQVIFFALLFGYCVTRCPEPHQSRLKQFFESAFEAMMTMATLVLELIPYGVFCLLVKVVGEAGFGLFAPLAKYMATVAVGLVFHACVTLALLVWFLGKTNPLRWARAVSPALLTAFSTSSSSMTLPVTMETVEEKGKVSNRVTSFTLPLGATINMDGTALYECAGVIFLAQYYASVTGGPGLTVGDQLSVVVMALLASIGAAGVPSAGLVMMLTILTALDLPIEGAMLLLAVDRPLDMMRTAVNVWSDTCAAAIIACTEGEVPLGPDQG